MSKTNPSPLGEGVDMAKTLVGKLGALAVNSECHNKTWFAGRERDYSGSCLLSWYN